MYNVRPTNFPRLASKHRLTGKHRRPRRRIRLLPGVQIIQNPRIRRLIRTRQTHTRRRLTCTPTRNVDLRTLHIELRAARRTRAVQRDQLAAEKVLAWGDAGRDCDGLDSAGGNEAVNAPGCAVEGILGDLCGRG